MHDYFNLMKPTCLETQIPTIETCLRLLVLNSTNVFARFHNEEPEFLLPFLVAPCTLKHYHCNAKPHQWKVLKPLYETHSILGLIVQS